MNPWLTFSLLFLLVWAALFLLKKSLRSKMFLVSISTMLFGLTEPLFVPEYWNPPSLFNLAARTGFDLESFIFCFAVGGIGAVLYDSFTSARFRKMGAHERHAVRHRFHLLVLASPVIVFIPLLLMTSWNSIYVASLAMLVGGIAMMLCRPDLKREILIGGLLFLGLYFVFFFLWTLAYPSIVEQVWNLKTISGILIFGVPLEELLFAFTFGMMWSGVYEHVSWLRHAERVS